MKKKTIIILSIVLSILIYVGYSISIFKIQGHKSELYDYKKLICVFKEAERRYIDTTSLGFDGAIGKNDILYNYVYKKDYYIMVWKLNEMKGVNANNIIINNGVNLDNVDFYYSEGLNENQYYVPNLKMKLGFSLKNTFNINIDRESNIIRTFNSTNYKGFYGSINKITLSNEKNKHVVLLKYKSRHEPTVFLLYKMGEDFYVIVVNSKKQLDDDILKIFQLE